MASSTSEKFNRLFNVKEQIRKAINRKGVRVPETLPLEQYANKIEAIPFYDYNSPDADFENFISTYYTVTASKGYQFYQNTSLQHLDTNEISYLTRMGFSTVPNLINAFYGCTALQNVAAVSFTNVTSAQSAFYSCTALRNIDLSIESNISNMDNMFSNCINLSTLKLNIVSYSSSMSCSNMFSNTNLHTLTNDSQISLSLPSFNSIFASSNITDLSFLKFTSLTSTANSASWSAMFSGCASLKNIDLPNEFTYTPPTSLNSMFASTTFLTSEHMSNVQAFFNKLDKSSLSSMSTMFRYKQTYFDHLNLEITLPIEGQSCSINNMFSSRDSSVTYIAAGRGPVTYFKFNGAGSASELFSEYSSYPDNTSYHPLTEVITIDLPYVTTLSQAFLNCSYLEQVHNFTTGTNLTNVSSMFSGCKRLTAIPLFNTTNVTTMNQMFYGCAALANVPTFDTSSCYNFGYMFYNCSSLISVPSFNLNALSQNSNWGTAYTSTSNPLYYMFYGCTSLAAIHMQNIKSSFDISYSTAFTREALLEILDNLVDVSAARVLHMGQTNLDKLTAEDIAIATAKGWTLN